MAEQWKGYSKITQKYAGFLQSSLNVQKPLSVLVSEAERLLEEVIRAVSTRSTVGHKSLDPCFHKKYMEAGVMTFVAYCNCRSIDRSFF